MIRIERFLALAIGLVVAGGLGYKFQPSFEPVKYVIYVAAILMFSEILYRIDKHTSA